jgi:hypothetical protein
MLNILYMEVLYKFIYVNVCIKIASKFYFKYNVYWCGVYTNHKLCYIFIKIENICEKMK